MLVVLGGTVGYYYLGGGIWQLDECLFMTLITLSTVGFAELEHMHEVPGARVLTMLLIVSGIGALAYFQGNLTALLVEGVIGQALRRSRMQKRIDSLRGHIVVAGAGATGKHVLEELVLTQTPFVVIDMNEDVLKRLSNDVAGGKMLYVHGDATDDSALLQSGVKRARAVIAALTQDKDNLYVTLSARSLNPDASIVAKVIENDAEVKMLKAGASSVVNPTMIGGLRMASEIIRPEVNEFLDQMLLDKDKNLRLEEVPITAQSTFVGQTLKESPIRKETDVLVVAVRDRDGVFRYNPSPAFVMEGGTTLIVLGETSGILKLRKLIRPD